MPWLGHFKPINARPFEGASEEDVRSSATLRVFKNDPRLAGRLVSLLNQRLKNRERMVDLGVGYGFGAQALKLALGFKNTVGFDADDERLAVARERGIETHHLDLETAEPPFPVESVDLVVCFGVLNYFKSYDSIIGEIHRVLRPGGIFVVSLPNLGWWVNRLSLLLGFQPPHVGVSLKYAVGLPSFYPRQNATMYVHSVTKRGLNDLLRSSGFDVVRIFGGREADYDEIHGGTLRVLAKAADAIFSKSSGLTVRIIAVGEKR